MQLLCSHWAQGVFRIPPKPVGPAPRNGCLQPWESLLAPFPSVAFMHFGHSSSSVGQAWSAEAVLLLGHAFPSPCTWSLCVFPPLDTFRAGCKVLQELSAAAAPLEGEMDANLLGMWHRDRKLRMGCLNASASLGSGIRTFCKCTLCLHTRVVLPQGMQLRATQVHVLMVQGAWHRGVRNSLLCAPDAINVPHSCPAAGPYLLWGVEGLPGVTLQQQSLGDVCFAGNKPHIGVLGVSKGKRHLAPNGARDFPAVRGGFVAGIHWSAQPAAAAPRGEDRAES